MKIVCFVTYNVAFEDCSLTYQIVDKNLEKIVTPFYKKRATFFSVFANRCGIWYYITKFLFVSSISYALLTVCFLQQLF